MKVIFCFGFWVIGLLSAFGRYDGEGGSKQKFTTRLDEVSYGERVVPVKIYLPVGSNSFPMPVLLMSHGLGGSRETGAYLGEHWASCGYLVVALHHIGSDNSLLEGAAVRDRIKLLVKAAGVENFLHRVNDVRVVLDVLELWNEKEEHFLYKSLDMNRVGMAGHSFGAMTTQAVSGQKFGGKAIYTDGRIKAAFAMSPSFPKKGGRSDFDEVKVPWLLMTGSKDTSYLRKEVTVASRRAVYDSLPERVRYELFLEGAKHSVFSGRKLIGGGRKNEGYHDLIMVVSSAFWDAMLKGDGEAKRFLKEGEVKKVLRKGDVWRF